jgi:hypothetical protein
LTRRLFLSEPISYRTARQRCGFSSFQKPLDRSIRRRDQA